MKEIKIGRSQRSETYLSFKSRVSTANTIMIRLFEGEFNS